MRMIGASASHAGQIRKSNQDRATFSDDVGAVADGMGGHLGGEQAASIVVAHFATQHGPMSQDTLVELVREANRKVHEESAQPELRGMGTTVVAAALDEDGRTITVVNVGDSRGYRLRGDSLEQVTVDHSLVEELLRQGRISPDEARNHPQRNIVTRAIGLDHEIDVDVFELEAEVGDRLLLCSDGLFNEVSEDFIAEELGRPDDVGSIAGRLVDAAVEAGGRDNVSVVVIELVTDAFGATALVDRPENEAVSPNVPRPLLADTQEHDTLEASAADPIESSPAGAGPAPPRSVAFRLFLVVFLVLAAALGALALYGNRSYDAAEQDGRVVIVRERFGSVLGRQPETVSTDELVLIEDLTPGAIEKVRQQVRLGSLSEAEDFVANLERIDDGDPTRTAGLVEN